MQLDLRALYRNSPVAFLGYILIGVANGAFGTLGAVYGAATGISVGEIALMMSASVLGGALMQFRSGVCLIEPTGVMYWPSLAVLRH